MDFKGKKAVLYRRVSTTDQKNFGNSLNAQKSTLRRFCDSNQVTVLREFEEDHSAKNFDRPEFNRLLHFVTTNRREVDLVLVTQWDRFARNLLDALGMIQTLDKLGVEVNATSNPIDPKDPYQFLAQVLPLAMAEGENRVKSDRVIIGMRQGLKDGRYNNKAPKGYLNTRDEEGKPLIQPDPIRAQLVAELFEEYARGHLSQNQLLKDPRFKDLSLSKSNLSRMLSNPTYAGKVFIPAYRDEPEQLIDGRHQALIKWTTFQKVQDHISGRNRNKDKPSTLNESFPLRGHLKCPTCGSTLTGSRSKSKTGKHYFYYHCNPRVGCNHRRPVHEYESALNELLSDFQPQPEVVEVFKMILEDHFEAQDEKHFKQVAKLQRELTDLGEKKERMIGKLIAGELDDHIIQRAIEKIDSDSLEKEMLLDKLNGEETGMTEFLDFGMTLLTHLGDFYSKGSPKTKRQLLSSILSEKLELKGKKYRTPTLKPGFNHIYQSVSKLEERRKKKGEPVSELSLSVPLTGHFSNSFFENVDELLALRDSLQEEGLMANLLALPTTTGKGPSTPIPYRP